MEQQTSQPNAIKVTDPEAVGEFLQSRMRSEIVEATKRKKESPDSEGVLSHDLSSSGIDEEALRQVKELLTAWEGSLRAGEGNIKEVCESLINRTIRVEKSIPSVFPTVKVKLMRAIRVLTVMWKISQEDLSLKDEDFGIPLQNLSERQPGDLDLLERYLNGGD